MRFINLVIGTALLLTAGTAIARERLTGEARLARILDGRVAGQPVNCISLSNARSSEVVDDTAIVYRSGGTLYVNRPRIGADALDDDSILVTRTTSNTLCSIDMVHLIDRVSHFQRGFVTLGEFVPYRKAK